MSAPAEVFDQGQVTQWLSALDGLQPQAANRLFELLYDDLRGHQEVSLDPARVRYSIKEGKAVLVLDGEALTAAPL